MLSLIVKGNRREAEHAAKQRGIAFEFVRVVRGCETVGLVADVARDRVAKWFGEGGSAPFPIGTLLLYSEVDDTKAASVQRARAADDDAFRAADELFGK